VGVAAVVVGAFLIATWKPQQSQNVQTAAGMPVFAPQGQVVPNFPQELILDANPSITGSYSINYSSSTNQYTAEWNSSTSADTLVAKYQSYFAANGWTATLNPSASSFLHSISASKDTAEVLVTIVDQGQGKGSQDTVTYSAQ